MKGGAGEDDRRGMANLVGIVLLVGLTLLGALVVVMVGSSALGSVADQQQDDVAEDSMREMSAQIGSVADSSVDTSSSFSFTDGVANEIELQADSNVTIAVTNGSMASIRDDVDDQQSNEDVYTFPGSGGPQTMGTMVYERSDGTLVAYQGGGLWSVGTAHTQVLEEPNLDWDGSTVDFSLINVSAQDGVHVAGDREVVASNDVAESRQSAAAVHEALETAWTTPDNGTVPVNMSITIKGPFADGWAAYANESMTVTPDVEYHASNDTVRMEFDRLGSETPGSDSPNGTNGTGSTGPGNSTTPDDAMEVNSTKALTVHQDEARVSLHSAEIGKAVEITNETEGRDPMDVVFAIDETGSMTTNDDEGQRIDATRSFIDTLNASNGDRSGFVQFTTTDYTEENCRWEGWRRVCDRDYHVPQHNDIVGYHELSTDLGAVKGDLDEWAQGGTNITRGIDVATTVHTNQSDPKENRVIVLLTDGRNQDSGTTDSATVEAARRAHEDHGITIYPVGLGDNVDDSLMRQIEDVANGTYYHADDADELEELFGEIANETQSPTTTHQIERTNTTLTAHQAVSQSITADGSNVNNAEHFADNTSDPVTTTVTGLQEGDNLYFSLTLKACGEYEQTAVGSSNNGTVYNHTRCTMAGSDQFQVDNGTVDDYYVFRGGDSVSTLATLKTEWWQSEPAPLLDAYHDGSTFDLQANESIIALSVDDPTTGQSGYVLMHVEVDEMEDPPDSGGSSTDTSTGAGVDPISIGVSEIAVS